MTSWTLVTHLFVMVFLNLSRLSQQHCDDYLDLSKNKENLTESITLIKRNNLTDTVNCTLENMWINGKKPNFDEKLISILVDCFNRTNDKKETSPQCEGGESVENVPLYLVLCMTRKALHLSLEGCEFGPACDYFSKITSTATTIAPTIMPPTIARTTLPPTTTAAPPKTTLPERTTTMATSTRAPPPPTTTTTTTTAKSTRAPTTTVTSTRAPPPPPPPTTTTTTATSTRAPPPPTTTTTATSTRAPTTTTTTTTTATSIGAPPEIRAPNSTRASSTKAETQSEVIGSSASRESDEDATNTQTLYILLAASVVLNLVLPLAVFLYMHHRRRQDYRQSGESYESNRAPTDAQPQTELEPNVLASRNVGDEEEHLMQPSQRNSTVQIEDDTRL